MLITLLQSIKMTNSELEVKIYYQEVDENLFKAVKVAFDFEFIQLSFNLSADRIQRISSKTILWDYALNHEEESQKVLFVDVDMLFIKPIEQYLDNRTCDVLFTVKDENGMINTGVVAVINNQAARNFFKKWEMETVKILSDPVLLEKANSIYCNYGAADQMSFNQIINYSKKEDNYCVMIEELVVNLKAVPCNILNVTNSTPVNEEMLIIHYKSGWQRVLIDGDSFNRNRRRMNSIEMYKLYIYYFKLALDRVNLMNKTTYTAKQFNIIIPYWLYIRNRSLSDSFYAIVVIRTFLKRVKKYFIRKLHSTLSKGFSINKVNI